MFLQLCEGELNSNRRPAHKNPFAQSERKYKQAHKYCAPEKISLMEEDYGSSGNTSASRLSIPGMFSLQKASPYVAPIRLPYSESR
jgi:hypothetical protein